MRSIVCLSLAGCTAAPAAEPSIDAPVITATCDDTATIPIAGLTAHNTSASPTYDRTHFGANFGPSTWITQAGATMPVDPDRFDMSLNPVTPGHVSAVDVHTLIPSRPDLKWFAHVVPWFHTPGGVNHIDIGVQSADADYVAAMLADMRRRGFDGLVINWYGKDSYTDQVTKLIQQQLAATPDNHFTFILMLDKGIAGLSATVLQQQIEYCKTKYFSDPNYEHEGAKPIVMFFGVTAVVGDAGMAQVKAATGNAVWVTQGANALASSWVDQAFDWAHVWHDGVSATDPYNLGGVRGFYNAVKTSPKHVFGSMAGSFNGMLTKTVGWSKGKYLPTGDGECVVEWANTIDQVISPNVTRMQWVTWNDWEEGSIIESGIENRVGIAAMLDGTMLRWQLTGNEATIDHYEVYAATDGDQARMLATVAAGSHELDITGSCARELFVIAVGKPNIRDHASNRVAIP